MTICARESPIFVYKSAKGYTIALLSLQCALVYCTRIILTGERRLVELNWVSRIQVLKIKE